MLKKVIKIDEEKCVGCGLCTQACHEGAIALVDGKAKLVREDYCDGLGNCLPVCPTNAISFEEKEVAGATKKAVKATSTQDAASSLQQWPVQLQLVPVQTGFFDNCDLLIAADCTAYAYGDFHNKLMKNKTTIIGCPKLDVVDYTAKITEIIKNNAIKSITVARMEVPCCSGLEIAVKTALKNSGKTIPCHTVTIFIDGQIKED